MKKLILIVTLGIFTFSQVATAQNKGKGNRPQKQQPKEKVKEGASEVTDSLDKKKPKGPKEKKHHKGPHGKKDSMKQHKHPKDSLHEHKEKEHDMEEHGEKKGHAYGKNKESMSGREFGKERAEQAKAKKEEKKKELDKTIKTNEDKVSDAKDRINKAREKAEKQKADGEITEEQYLEKMEKIKKAEAKMLELEQKVKKNKS